MSRFVSAFSVVCSHSIPLYTAALLLVVLVVLKVYSNLSKNRPWQGIPLIAVNGLSPKRSWFLKGNEVLKKGLEEYPGGLFQVMTGTGPKIIVPNCYVDELRNHDRLSFADAFKPDLPHNIPGIIGPADVEKSFNIIQNTVRIKLTQSLGLITDALVDETRQAVHDILGESPEWKTSELKAPVLDLVARLTSRTFLGPELCRNQRWLEIAKGYTVNVFVAARLLRMLPESTRSFMHWFLPPCRNVRRDIVDANRLIAGEVERRRLAAEMALAAGKKPPKSADAIAWMVEMSKGQSKIDYVSCQLSLSMASIHTTTEALLQFFMDLCENPEYIEPLRKEIIAALREHGWSRNALYQLKLMDSFLKESQRLQRPISGIQRGVLGNDHLMLSDGTEIPNRSRIIIVSEHVNPQVYPDPFKFDATRFMRKREQNGQMNSYQFVTTSSDHLGFGYGRHSCPGRFFATDEIKIALSHLLLKYDWRLIPGKQQKARLEYEAVIRINPSAEIQWRRRKEEIDL